MRCIFCKSDSSSSRSIEHIIPESLGNENHTLPRGVVCDACNNYFARKIERPVLESEMIRLLRADMRIPNKRGVLPSASGSQRDLPDYRLMSRFLAKVGLEVMASHVLNVAGWNDELVENLGLDPLRGYVRFNEGAEAWPFAYRALYPVNAIFNENGVNFELLHEYQILATDTQEYYVGLALFGVEFVLNLGGPMLEGWERWLAEHEQSSPLYPTAT